jgi:hypothetical protein
MVVYMSKEIVRKRYPDWRRRVCLCLWHKNLDPSEITRKLNIEPESSWYRGPVINDDGEVIRNKTTGKPYEKDYGQWNLTALVRENARLDTQMKSILEQVMPRKAVLRKILKKVNSELSIAVGPHCDIAMANYFLPADLINEFTSLGIDVVFRVYITPNVERIKKEMGVSG